MPVPAAGSTPRAAWQCLGSSAAVLQQHLGTSVPAQHSPQSLYFKAIGKTGPNEILATKAAATGICSPRQNPHHQEQAEHHGKEQCPLQVEVFGCVKPWRSLTPRRQVSRAPLNWSSKNCTSTESQLGFVHMQTSTVPPKPNPRLLALSLTKVFFSPSAMLLGASAVKPTGHRDQKETYITQGITAAIKLFVALQKDGFYHKSLIGLCRKMSKYKYAFAAKSS